MICLYRYRVHQNVSIQRVNTDEFDLWSKETKNNCVLVKAYLRNGALCQLKIRQIRVKTILYEFC